jgi:hypothetical protein
MAYLGSWKIDDYLTFYANTHRWDTGVATDADVVPPYRVYEDETATAIATGNMALLDTGNTEGFYSERLQLLAATGFEKGKQYGIYISKTVNSVETTVHHTFQIEAEVDANNISSDSTAAVADAVWDEVLTSATHDVGYSAGQRLRYLILSGGLARAGSTSTAIQLAAAESATDEIHTENIVSIVDGTGVGQTRLIVEYDGATRLATVDREWAVTPSTDSVYELLPFAGILLATHGTAQAGTASTITLATTALAVADSYVGCAIYISSGTGIGQTRLITAYTAGRVASVSPDWETTPGATSVYKVLPVGRAIVDSIGSAAEVLMGTAVWESSTRTLTTPAVTVTETAAGTISVRRGDTMSQAITGLGDLTGYTTIDFTVKEHEDDLDSEAIIWIRLNASGVDDGLLRFNGAATTGDEDDGAITVDVLGDGDITITLDETRTDDLAVRGGLVYDVQTIISGSVSTLSKGTVNITADVTRAVT